MNKPKNNDVMQEAPSSFGFYSSISDSYCFGQNPPIEIRRDILPLSRPERLKLAIDDLQIGRRVREELKEQGRTVGWLAKNLDMERTSLYYTFRQNSIDLGLLVRISFYLEHNFIQDIDNVYKSYGL